MACKDGSCGLGLKNVTIIKSIEIPSDLALGIERYFYEYSGFLNLMKDIYVNDFEMPKHRYLELRQEYLDAFVMHQMMMSQVGSTMYSKEELYKYSLMIDFANGTLDLVDYNSEED